MVLLLNDLVLLVGARNGGIDPFLLVPHAVGRLVPLVHDLPLLGREEVTVESPIESLDALADVPSRIGVRAERAQFDAHLLGQEVEITRDQLDCFGVRKLRVDRAGDLARVLPTGDEPLAFTPVLLVCVALVERHIPLDELQYACHASPL